MMVIYNYKMERRVQESELESIIEIFGRNGFAVNRDDSRKKGVYDGIYAYVKLDKRLPNGIEFHGYDLMGNGFIARIGKELEVLSLDYEPVQIERLKEELERG